MKLGFNSNFRPDLATRPVPSTAHKALLSKIGDKEKRAVLEALLQPIIIAGEAKQAPKGDLQEANPEKPHFTVQLAMAAYPGLILSLIHALDGKPFSSKPPVVQLPKDCFIYGFYFDGDQLILHAHFPVYRNQAATPDKDKEVGWRFAQARLCKLPLAMLGESAMMSKEAARRRLRMAIALHAVRQHGMKLQKIFSSDKYCNMLFQMVEIA